MNAIAANADIQIRGSPTATAATAEVRPSSPSAEAQKQTPIPLLDASAEQVQQAVEGVNGFLKSSGTHVQFAMNEEAKRMMVEVLDDRTGEVIQTIPSKELIDLASRIGEMVGVLLDKKG